MRLVKIATNAVIDTGIVGVSLQQACLMRNLPVTEYKLEPESETEAKLSTQATIINSMSSYQDKATAALSLLGTTADGASISLVLLATIINTLNSLPDSDPIKAGVKNSINTFFGSTTAFSDLVVANTDMFAGVTAGTIKLPFRTKYTNIKAVITDINKTNTLVSNALASNVYRAI
jgi:hypothetical protein